MDIKPFIYQTEANAARLERTIQRLWIALILTIMLLVSTNWLWICYEMQFEEVTTTVTQDVDSGSGNAIINDGVHINGEGQADNNH